MKASKLVLFALTLPWLVYLLGWGTDAGITLPVLLVSVWGGLALLVLWLLRLVLYRRGTRQNRAERHMRRVLLEPVVLLACVGMVWSGLGFRVRFLASRPALDRFVRDARPSMSRGEVAAGTRVGLFTVQEAELLPGGSVRLITTECMVVDDCGVAFSPDDTPPPVVGEDMYERLGGGWWHWWRSW